MPATPVFSHGARWTTWACASLLAAASLPVHAQLPAGTIEVVVKPLRNTQGGLGCQLFASADGFPMKGERAREAVMAPIAQPQSRCRFTGLPPGFYAVVVVHDENGNQKLDVNLFGLPTEGYGASNNRTYAMSAPRWEESRIELAAGETRELSVNLRY